MNLRIKEICKAKGVTITGLASELNIKQESLSRTINGNPTIETLDKIAKALNVSIVELFEPESDFYGIIQYKGITYRIDGFDAFKRLCMEVFNLDENYKIKVSKE